MLFYIEIGFSLCLATTIPIYLNEDNEGIKSIFSLGKQINTYDIFFKKSMFDINNIQPTSIR